MSSSVKSAAARPGLGFWDRISDWANPILVKEVRQAFKSRVFGFVFVLLLTVCWLISYFGTLSVGRGLEFYSYGPTFFSWYFAVLFGAIFVVVPLSLYWNMCAERLDDTLDTLNITTLHARRIINGKLAGALVQILFYAAAILPFIAFTSLLNGFRMNVAVLYLLIIFAVAITTSSLALALSSMTKSRIFQGIMGLALVGFVVVTYLYSVGGILSDFGIFDPPDSWEFYVPVIITIATLLAVALLLREIAISALTFEADNRSSGIRITLSFLFVVLWSIVPIMGFFYSGPIGLDIVRDMATTFTVCTAIGLGVVSIFLVSEPIDLSRRVRRQLPRRRLLKILFAPWFPGASRGYLFVLIHVAMVVAILCLIEILLGPSTRPSSYSGYGGYGYRESHPIIFSLDYLVIYSGLACLVTRIVRWRVPGMRAAEMRLAVFITVLGTILAPHIFDLMRSMLGRWDNDFHIWMILSPFFYQSWFLGYDLVAVLTFIALIVAVANIPGIGRDIVDMFHSIPSEPGSKPAAGQKLDGPEAKLPDAAAQSP